MVDVGYLLQYQMKTSIHSTNVNKMQSPCVLVVILLILSCTYHTTTAPRSQGHDSYKAPVPTPIDRAPMSIDELKEICRASNTNPVQTLRCYPYHRDCSKFIQCYHDQVSVHSCWPGTVFSSHISGCVYQGSESDHCTPLNPVSECESGQWKLIPHPTSCQGYFNCSRRDDLYAPWSVFGDFEHECMYPYAFDIDHQQCVPYQVVRCGPPQRKLDTWKCAYRRYQCDLHSCTQCPAHNPSCVDKKDGLYPHPYRMKSPWYIQCRDQRNADGQLYCGMDPLLDQQQLFHPDVRKCLPLWEVPKEYGGYKGSCDGKLTGYYDNDMINIIAYKCPGEQSYLCKPPISFHANISYCIPISQEGFRINVDDIK